VSLRIAARIARRELRAGLSGFWVFLACLSLGVGAIAAVGSVRAAISAGLEREGAALLGGDAELRLTYRVATEDERAWMESQATAVSEIIDFRSMAITGTGDTSDRSVTQVKAVDSAYPLVGTVTLDPPIPLDVALSVQDGIPGGVMDRLLVDRLGMQVGDIFRLGVQDFRLSAILAQEPDSSTAGFGLGPRTLVARQDLADAGLLGLGTLFTSQYRLSLPPGSDLDAVKARVEAQFEGAGVRWRDSRNGAPGVSQFVDRIGSFLVLVGLAGLAVGGVGVSSAVRAYLDAKTNVIAILKTLGAESRTIFAVYFIQIGLLTVIGVAIGVILGAAVPIALAPIISAQLPIPAEFSLHIAPLLEAALYGFLTALIFTLWPLASTEQVRAAAIFRGIGTEGRAWPRWPYLIAIGVTLTVLVVVAAVLSEVPNLAIGSAAGIIGALIVLVIASMAVRWIARRAARAHIMRGKTALRMAFGAVANPREGATAVILSLGLGLTVLAAVGQVDSNLRRAITDELPLHAPSYFFLDIQPDQLVGFMERVTTDPAVSDVQTAPMLRGVVTEINGNNAREVAGGHWVVRGDRGITFAATQAEGITLTEGTWWAEDYAGPPLVSFATEEGIELGLSLGDTITVNVLGRDITATIANFREVDFSTGGMGFVMTFSPSPLQAAPHTHIATVYAEQSAEAVILRDLSNAYPNITAIGVRDAAERVGGALSSIAAATSYAAAATLLTGFIVLIGAAAAGERARVFEAAVMKTLGASRGKILLSFALRSALMGAAAGAVALGAGALAAWGVMTFVMDFNYSFAPASAIAIIAGGIFATLLAGLAFAWRPLAARPARILRTQE
jgi:putative ABC transport system permease protein